MYQTYQATGIEYIYIDKVAVPIRTQVSGIVKRSKSEISKIFAQNPNLLSCTRLEVIFGNKITG